MIIGITGTLGSGKGAIADYLIEKGFKHFSVREFLLDIIRQKGMPENRDSMVSVGNELRQLHGSSYLVEQLYERAQFFEEKMPNSIIESIRTVGEVEALKAKGNFYLIAVDADIEKRYLRVSSRASGTDMVSFEQFQEDELREMTSDDPTKQNLIACKELADFVVDNSGSFEYLRDQIDGILEKIELEKRISSAEDVDAVEEASFASTSTTHKEDFHLASENLKSETDVDTPSGNPTSTGVPLSAPIGVPASEDEGEDESESRSKIIGETDFGEVKSFSESKISEKIKGRQDYIPWDEYFMGIALLSAHKSKDPSTQVGACIVDKDRKIVGIGYNGFPKGCNDEELPWEREGEYDETKYAYVAHAELNAILNSSKKLEGCSIYIALFPCNECAKAIIQSGIRKVVYMSDKYAEVAAFKASRRLLGMAGIELVQFSCNNKIVLDFGKDI